MKKYLIFFTIALCASVASRAQEVNWRSFSAPYKHIVSVNFGVDYGTYYGLAYGYKLPGRLPVVFGTEISIPFGHDVLDDWKVKISGQSELWHNEQFSLSVQPGMLVRRYQSEVARLYNISADLTTTFGYYRPAWGVAAAVNFDKTLSSHIRHDRLKDYYPEIRDGWYGSTGGNFKLGVKGNYAWDDWSIFLKAGKIFAQDFKDNPTLPFFFEISLLKYL